MKKKNIIILIIGVILLIGVVIGAILLLNNKSKTSDNIRFKEEYERLNGQVIENEEKYLSINIPENNKAKYVNSSEVMELFNNMGNRVVYVGNDTCLYCRSISELLVEVTNNSDIKEFYYLKTDNDIAEVLDKINEKIQIDKERIITEGIVLFIVNGNIVSYNIGTLFSHENPNEKMDEFQIKGLKEIYASGLNDVLEGIKISNN